MKLKPLQIFTSPFVNKDQIILRDYLALERTRLANERTLLSYIRTSLFFLTGGIALIQIDFLEHIHNIGIFSIFLSAFLLAVGIIRYIMLARRVRAFYPNTKKKEEREEDDEPETV